MGVFDKIEHGILYLESSSQDLQHFRFWHPLPWGYRYLRPANRRELRDYIFNFTYYECQQERDLACRSLIPVAADMKSCTHL